MLTIERKILGINKVICDNIDLKIRRFIQL